jgi:hypothetical protein
MTEADRIADQVHTVYRCPKDGATVRPTPIEAWKTGDRTS